MPTMRHTSPGQLVKIPSQFKKLVSGPRGDNLRSVSTLTGAEVSQLGGQQLYVTGTKKRVQHAEFLLRNKVVSFTHALFFLIKVKSLITVANDHWCFSTLVNYYFEAFFNLKVILQKLNDIAPLNEGRLS